MQLFTYIIIVRYVSDGEINLEKIKKETWMIKIGY